MSERPDDICPGKAASPASPDKLDYRSGIDDRRDRPPLVPLPVQALLAFFGSTVLIGGVVVGGIAVSNGVAGGVMALVLTIALLACTALVIRQNEKMQGYAAGIWVGIAIAGLIEGLCFVTLS